MDDLLDIIRWTVRDPYRPVLVPKRIKHGKTRMVSRFEPLPPGQGGLLLYHKKRFVELAFLAGFQAAQRCTGIDNKSPKYVVDVQMRLREKSKTKPKLLGWNLTRKDGTESTLVATTSVIKRSKPAKKKSKPVKKSLPAATPGKETEPIFSQLLEG